MLRWNYRTWLRNGNNSRRILDSILSCSVVHKHERTSVENKLLQAEGPLRHNTIYYNWVRLFRRLNNRLISCIIDARNVHPSTLQMLSCMTMFIYVDTIYLWNGLFSMWHAWNRLASTSRLCPFWASLFTLLYSRLASIVTCHSDCF